MAFLLNVIDLPIVHGDQCVHLRDILIQRVVFILHFSQILIEMSLFSIKIADVALGLMGFFIHILGLLFDVAVLLLLLIHFLLQ